MVNCADVTVLGLFVLLGVEPISAAPSTARTDIAPSEGLCSLPLFDYQHSTIQKVRSTNSLLECARLVREVP
jgi:hypothetical protein